MSNEAAERLRQLRRYVAKGAPNGYTALMELDTAFAAERTAERRATVERIRPLVKQASEGGWRAIDAILDEEAAR